VDGDLAAPAVHDAEVANAARRATRDPAAEVLEWAVTAIPHVGIIDTTGGLHLVVARVRSRDAEVSLSLVLKVLTRPPDDECHSPGSWCYWRREAEFYGSTVERGGVLVAVEADDVSSERLRSELTRLGGRTYGTTRTTGTAETRPNF